MEQLDSPALLEKAIAIHVTRVADSKEARGNKEVLETIVVDGLEGWE